MQVPIGNIPGELVRELRRRKWLSFLIFMTVSFVVLGVGLLWPQKYTSSLTIFVDSFSNSSTIPSNPPVIFFTRSSNILLNSF